MSTPSDQFDIQTDSGVDLQTDAGVQLVTQLGPPSPVPTSGTVSTTQFTTQQMLDHAFRRCKIPSQKITDEYIDTALDLLYLILSSLCNKGIALWTITKDILPIYESIYQVPMPLGRVDVFAAMLRTSQIITGTPTSSQGVAANAFDQNLSTACIQASAGGYIDLSIAATDAIPIYGILPGTNDVWNISIQVSTDGGVTYQNIYSNAALEVADGQWFWVDIQGVPDGVTNVRLQANGETVLNVIEFTIEQIPNEIPMAKMSRDDYDNFPDKWFKGRPVQFWYDKQIPNPILTLWPSPQLEFTFNQIVTYSQRYPQDVGTLTDIIEVPQRWYLPIICELADHLMSEIPEAQADPMKVSMIAAKQMQAAWDGESDGGPMRIVPQIRAYTRC
jgi:hypothetical protein